MKWFKHSKEVEKTFLWLIKVGILRREVDGQGLTSKIRLTPLGRKLLEESPDLPAQEVTMFEHLHYWIKRNLSW